MLYKLIKYFTPLFVCLGFLITNTSCWAQSESDSTSLAAVAYPNPFSETLIIEHNKSPENIEEIAIYDALGNMIYVFSESEWWDNNLITWSGESNTGLPSPGGIYILNIRTKDETESILIQKS